MFKFLFRGVKVRGPMHVRLPSLAVDNEAGILFAREREKTPEIPGKGVSSLRVRQNCMGGELANFEPVIEDHVGLESGIHEEEIARQLR